MDVKIAAALITGAASLIVALIAFIAGRLNAKQVHRLQLRLVEEQQRTASELESQKLYLSHKLEERRATEDARRDYEYDARRRLYEQCEPLLFQALGLAENASNQIIGLAQSAWRRGIKADGTGWLGRPSYYFQSTAFTLLAPLTTAKLLQRRLTTVDLSLEPRLQLQYELLTSVYLSFASDFQLAARAPEIPYDPDRADPGEADRDRLLSEAPERYRRQGLYFGTLEIIAESLLADSDTRCKSFGEFVADWNKLDTRINNLIPEIAALFRGFHPKACPVLWRVLISQFLHHGLFLSLQRQGVWKREQVRRLMQMPTGSVLSQFDWRSEEDEATMEILEEPFKVAHAHLLETVDRIQSNLVEH